MFEEYNDLLSIDELCELLAIGKNSAYQLLNSKQLKAFRIGSVWKIPKKSIEEFILLQSGLLTDTSMHKK